jgi:hypothetical protein
MAETQTEQQTIPKASNVIKVDNIDDFTTLTEELFNADPKNV